MKAKFKKVFKLFWVWQDKAQEEWLQKMSAQGLHLKSLKFGFYVFENGSPQQYSYRMDYQPGAQKDFTEYLEMFDVAGWEYIGKFSGWHYFRKSMNEGGIMEIYTDNETKVKKFEKRLHILFFTTPGFFIIFLGSLDRYPVWFAVLLASVILGIILYSAINAIMLIVRIKELKK